MEEERIKEELEKRFPCLKDRLLIKRKLQMYLEVEQLNFEEVFVYLVRELSFSRIATITGLDEIDNFAVVYHLESDSNAILNLKVKIDKGNPVMKSVTAYFRNADIYEREIMDLLGIRVEGLAPGGRYPLPDNWPEGQYPLRKDWKEASHA